MHCRQEGRDVERRKVHEEGHDCAENQGFVLDGAIKENGDSMKKEDTRRHDGDRKQEKRQYLSPRFVSVSFPCGRLCVRRGWGLLAEPLTLAISTPILEFLP